MAVDILPSHRTIKETLEQRERLSVHETVWLRTRGVPARYWEMTGYKQVKHLAAAGFTADDICDLVDLPDGEVYELYATIPDHLPDIVQLHAAGFTPVEISEELDIPRPTIYYHLHDLGVQPARKRAAEITVTQQAQVEKLRSRGESYRDIAAKLNITYEQVRAAVRRSNNGL